VLSINLPDPRAEFGLVADMGTSKFAELRVHGPLPLGKALVERALYSPV
jgi:hypothetical protein